MTKVTIANRAVTSVLALSIPVCWIFNTLFLLFHLLWVFLIVCAMHIHCCSLSISVQV